MKTATFSQQKVSGTFGISDALQGHLLFMFPLLILDHNFLKVKDRVALFNVNCMVYPSKYCV